MVIMLATDICRLVLKHQPTTLLSQLQAWSADGDEIVISAITYAEMVAAALLTSEQERHMHLVEAFCERLDAVVPWDSAAVESYTTLQRTIMSEGRRLNMNDVMIAAHAISLDARLLSNTAATFEGIDNLDLSLWQDAGRDEPE
jgi:tRNA(fMet)-specific endonuclease VapC